MKIKYAFVCFLGRNRNGWLKKNKIFKEFGENVLFQPYKLPNEPKLIKIHNNVRIATNVSFFTHDVLHQLFATIDQCEYQGHSYCIEIFDNCFIGGNSTITGNITIGPNSIVAAGSVVNKDVPSGTVVAGNPAKVIGTFEDLHKKRMKIDGNKSQAVDADDINDQLWEQFYNRKMK